MSYKMIRYTIFRYELTWNGSKFFEWTFSKIVREILIRQETWLYTYMKKFLKNLLLRNWSDFETISQECSLGDLFQKCSWNFDPSINMALVNWGFLHYTHVKKFLKKSSSLRPLVRFWKKFTDMFLGWPFWKIVWEILIHQQTWLWWMGASCTIRTWSNF